MSSNVPDVICPEDGSSLPPSLDQSQDPLSLSEGWTRERERERRASERSARKASRERDKEAAAAANKSCDETDRTDNEGHRTDGEAESTKDCKGDESTKDCKGNEPGVWIHPSLLALSKFNEVPAPKDILGEMATPFFTTFFRYEFALTVEHASA